jgi:hypothetical protein
MGVFQAVPNTEIASDSEAPRRRQPLDAEIADVWREFCEATGGSSSTRSALNGTATHTVHTARVDCGKEMVGAEAGAV